MHTQYRWIAVIALFPLAGCPPELAVDHGDGPSEASRFPRLTHAQWETTVKDLFYLAQPPELATLFQPDPQVGRFDNNIARLTVSAGLWRDYQNAAEVMADRAVTDAETLAAIVPADLPDGADAQARAFVEAFGRRAFRRPLTAEQLDSFATLFAAAAEQYPDDPPFTAGVRQVITGMLQSPFFLYRAELSDQIADLAVPLDGYEVASRLSYFFWNSMPDEPLLEAAEHGELDDEAGVREWGERLFDDPRSAEQLRRFHFQAFKMSDYDDLDKDEELFPEWSRELGVMMQDEASLFLGSIVAEGGGVADMLTSTRAFVNADLAELYGLEGDFGDELTEVQLDPTQRAGFVTRAGFLARNATLRESDPIHRGVFINLDLLCRDLPDRPNVPDNLMPVGDTTRERIESLTGEGTCAAECHTRMINPPGFGLEHYDAIGRYRTEDNGYPVDSADVYEFPDGRAIEFADGIELSQRLAESPETHACYISQMLEYVYGRDLRAADERFVEVLADRSLGEGLSIRDVVLDMVTSRAFRARPIPDGGAP
jgi:hypothetical protein